MNNREATKMITVPRKKVVAKNINIQTNQAYEISKFFNIPKPTRNPNSKSEKGREKGSKGPYKRERRMNAFEIIRLQIEKPRKTHITISAMNMEFELRRAGEKLQREQRERKERARLKLEREKKARAEAARLREAIAAAQSLRRLEAAEAEAMADEQMQEEMEAERGIVFRRILQAIPYEANGDRIKLPASCFSELSELGAFDKGPLHFCLSIAGDQDRRETHAGVLEFTSDEGCVGLPPLVWSNLIAPNITELPMVLVRYVWLPKGTYAKLQADEFGFSDVPNHKAVLETSLRRNATLTQGDVLKVHHGALVYSLRVLELKPSSSVSVLETDIEVDIIDSDSKPEEANSRVLRPLVFGKSESGTVEEGNYMYYKFFLDDKTWRGGILSGNVQLEIRLEPQISDGDCDVYVSRHPLLFPTRHQHGWSLHDVGTKVLILSSKENNMGPGTYSIGVYGFKGRTQYEMSINVRETPVSKVGQKPVSSSNTVDADTVECKNCNHYVPSRTIALHEAFCRRNNVLCQHPGCGVVLRAAEARNHVHYEKCSKVFQPAEMEKHMKVFHEPLQCPCGVVLEKVQMVQHQSSECPLRLVTCRFCGDMVQAGTLAADVRDRLRGLSEHESLCGSRTAPCDSCGRAVMLKEMDIHQVAVHQKS